MDTDVVIIGGGPAGTAAALYLQRHGIASTIIEKESFPRYHIGESLTGECGKCLRELGFEEAMDREQYPVKRGVKVYGPDGKNSFFVPTMGRSEEGNLFDATTWQVRRSDFDRMLLDKAVEQGANHIRGQAIEPLRNPDNCVSGVRYRDESGRLHELHSKVLVDASGQATFLSNAGVCSEKMRGTYDKQIAIFSQVKGAIRDEEPHRNDTLIFYQDTNHWSWFIPLDDEAVSIGVTCPSDYFSASKMTKHDFLLAELKTLNPEFARRLAQVELTEEVRAISNYSYHVRDYTGPGYLCIGDSHCFADPIFSYGVYVSIKEAEFAADAIAEFLRNGSANGENPFAAYQQLCDRGQYAVQALIDGFWNFSFAFAFFVHTRYTGEFIDLFSGRVYDEEPNRGLKALEALQRGVSQGLSAAGV